MFPSSCRSSLATVALALSALATLAALAKPPINAGRDGLAVKGYDVIAYAAGSATKGDPTFEQLDK